jgi:Zn-dependent peptidase ImmA (M78 family)
MRPKVYTCVLYPLLVLIILPASNGLGDGLNTEAVFAWTIRQMRIVDHYELQLPAIRVVSKATLRKTFVASSHKSFQRWQAMYGMDRAQQILEKYLHDIVGMFDPQTRVIYVGRFLSPCRQQAVLAHELVHFFQHQTILAAAIEAYDPDTVNMIREMEAYQIQHRFMEQNCGGPD